MHPDDIAQLKKLDIMLQSGRNWKERLNAKFVTIVQKMAGKYVAELVEWRLEGLFRSFVWEQKRRVELEMILAEHHPELLTVPAALPEEPIEPSWFKDKVA